MNVYKDLVKSLKMMERKLPLYMFAILMMTSFNALFEVIGSWFMKLILEIVEKGSLADYTLKIVLTIIAGLLSIVVASIFMCIYNNEAKQMTLKIKEDVYQKFMRLPYEYYEEHHSGEIISRLLNDTDIACNIYSSRLRRVLAPIIFVLIFGVAMMLTNPIMAFMLIALDVLLFIVNTLFSIPVKKIGKQLSHKNMLMTSILSNILSGIEIIKMYDTNNNEINKYKYENKEYTHIQKHKVKIIAVLEMLNTGFDLFCSLMFILVGIILIQNEMATLGEVVAIFTLYTSLSFRFLQLGKNVPELINCIAYARRIFYFLELPEEQDNLKLNTQDVSLPNLSEKVVNKNTISDIKVKSLEMPEEQGNPKFNTQDVSLSKISEEDINKNTISNIKVKSLEMPEEQGNAKLNTQNLSSPNLLEEVINKNKSKDMNDKLLETSEKDKPGIEIKNISSSNLSNKKTIKNNITTDKMNRNSENAIECKNITFTYKGKRKIFINDNYEFKANKIIALTGVSGSGKSTLAKLILGFYKLENGNIKLFGQNISDIGIKNARKQIAYIPQIPYLYNVSIKDNIRYAKVDATENEIINAAKLANAHQFITKLSNGYDTIIDSRGTNLSGGERQRIAIARAIIKNSPIILMDEATSALDNESEQLIKNSISKLKNNKTIIMIAHRTTTIQSADMVVKIKG